MPRSFQNALILLALLAAPARGAELACESLASLRAKVRDCEGNLAYATAGKACLDAFDAEVARSRASVAEALGAVISADGQSRSMGSAKKGYETALAALTALEARGRRLGAEVAAYKKEIVFPDDFGPAGEAGLSAPVFLDGQKCYSATRKLVESYAELLGLHAKELGLTRRIAAGLAGRAFRGEKGLRPEDVLPLLSGPKGKGAPAAPKGKSRQAPSDITGTEKKKAE
jgi:hypothetical protein